MTVLLEVELMEPEGADLKEILETKCRTGVLLRKYWPPSPAIAGDGEICLYSFHDEARAWSFLIAVFGPPKGEWIMKPVIDGLFYSHTWL
jgi:hypothetical protein